MKNANQTSNHAMFLFSVHDGFESHKNAEFGSLESAVCYIIVELPFLLDWSFTLTYQLVNVPIRLLYHVSGEHKYNQSMENLPDFLFTGGLLSGE